MKHFPAMLLVMASVIGYSQVADSPELRLIVSRDEQTFRIDLPNAPAGQYRIEQSANAQIWRKDAEFWIPAGLPLEYETPLRSGSSFFRLWRMDDLKPQVNTRKGGNVIPLSAVEKGEVAPGAVEYFQRSQGTIVTVQFLVESWAKEGGPSDWVQKVPWILSNSALIAPGSLK